jgi:ABC-2 type transport system permease protein
VTSLRIAWTNLRRMVRDRTNLFFLVLFPLLLIMVLGLAFGGEYAPRLAVASQGTGPLAKQLVADLEATSGIETQELGSRAEAVRAVEQGRAEGAVVVPGDYDTRLAAGEAVVLDYVSSADRTAQQVGTIVAAVVDQQAARVTVARLLQERLGGDLDGMLALADGTAAAVPDVAVEASTTGEAVLPEEVGRFDVGASGQLLLFIFITSMTASTALIETRKLGVSRRMFATPTSVRAIVAGEALGRIAIAVLQGVIIMLGSALLFGVSWGSPAAAALLMLAFAGVAGGAGMLMGSLATSTEQAIAIGLLLALGMGALGGAMMPLEFFSPTMYAVAHITPHAWAADGFAELIRRDGGVGDVVSELGVLVAYGAALFAAAAWGLRRSIARA